MGRVRFRGMDTFSNRNVVQGSTKYVDKGTSLTLQNQDVLHVNVRCFTVHFRDFPPTSLSHTHRNLIHLWFHTSHEATVLTVQF